MKRNIVREKSYAFAVKIVELHKTLVERRAYIIARQVLRSGTSIGANVEEALQAVSRKDFAAKLSIALREAHETKFWLRLLGDADIATSSELRLARIDVEELLRLLTSIIKTTRSTE